MDKRLVLHQKLIDISGVSNVYFQPPSGFKLTYPCIIYELSDLTPEYANNNIYKQMLRYTIKVITKDPDSHIHLDLLTLPYCSFDRFYTAENLNHYALTLYSK